MALALTAAKAAPCTTWSRNTGGNNYSLSAMAT